MRNINNEVKKFIKELVMATRCTGDFELVDTIISGRDEIISSHVPHITKGAENVFVYFRYKYDTEGVVCTFIYITRREVRSGCLITFSEKEIDDVRYYLTKFKQRELEKELGI